MMYTSSTSSTSSTSTTTLVASCVGVALLLVCDVIPQSEGKLTQKCMYGARVSNGRACSSAIPELVTLICSMHGMLPEKRSGVPSGELLLVDPFMAKQEAVAYFRRDSAAEKRNGYWQGITCECCHNQCTNHEVLEYCNAPVKTKRHQQQLTYLTAPHQQQQKQQQQQQKQQTKEEEMQQLKQPHKQGTGEDEDVIGLQTAQDEDRQTYDTVERVEAMRARRADKSSVQSRITAASRLAKLLG